MKNTTSIQPDLSIIILNYNGQGWLKTLLPSLKTNYLNRSRFLVEVIVVDNASTDGSVDYLRSIDGVRLIVSPVNGGFAYGNNLALQTAKARYLLLLNNDTEIPATGCNLDVLIEYMDKHKQAGIVTPKILLSDGRMDQACHRGEPTPWAAVTYFIKLDRMFPRSRCFARYHQSWKKLDEIHTIDACTGAAMLIRKTAMDKTGLLDERFFMYAEDVDWCKRFREAGFDVVYHPGVTLTHHKYQSGLKKGEKHIQSETRALFYKTMLQYYDKHYAAQYPTFYRAFLRLLIRVKLH